MADPTLAEVAADVAAALGLKQASIAQEPVWEPKEQPGGDYICLVWDGSNLTDPYWRCACEDWLLKDCKLEVNDTYACAHFYGDYHNEVWSTCVEGSWPEAPARLVSAVWRRMQQEKSDG